MDMPIQRPRVVGISQHCRNKEAKAGPADYLYLAHGHAHPSDRVPKQSGSGSVNMTRKGEAKASRSSIYVAHGHVHQQPEVEISQHKRGRGVSKRSNNDNDSRCCVHQSFFSGRFGRFQNFRHFLCQFWCLDFQDSGLERAIICNVWKFDSWCTADIYTDFVSNPFLYRRV